MATPWRWLAPDAEPSLTLIEESRYFRVASVPVSTAQAARLGGWWKFVVCTIAVYGVLPRVLTLMLARARLRAAIRASVIAAPGFSAVMRRLHAARVETVAVEPEEGNSKRFLDRANRAGIVARYRYGAGRGELVRGSGERGRRVSASAAIDGRRRSECRRGRSNH